MHFYPVLSRSASGCLLQHSPLNWKTILVVDNKGYCKAHRKRKCQSLITCSNIWGQIFVLQSHCVLARSMLLACLVYPKGGYSKFDLQPVSSHLRDEGSAIKYLWHITLAYDMMPMENDMSHHAEYDNIYLSIYDAFLNLSTILNLARKHKKAKHELKNILFFSTSHLTLFKISTGLHRWGRDTFKRHWEAFRDIFKVNIQNSS